MPDRLFGIPSHPLLVHLPVVLLPLCFLLAVWLVVRPRQVRHYGIPLIVLSGAASLGAFLAAGSGEGLQELLHKENRAIENHAEWGDRTKALALVFFLLVVGFVALARRWATQAETAALARPMGLIGVGAALVLVGAVMVVAVVYTGHTGAKSAWEKAGQPGR